MQLGRPRVRAEAENDVKAPLVDRGCWRQGYYSGVLRITRDVLSDDGDERRRWRGGRVCLRELEEHP